MYNYFRAAYYLACLLRHAHWKREQLLNYQNKKVREIVKYAYDNVPFYHEKFSQLGIKPEDVKTVGDLNKLPIIRRDELQKNNERLISKEFEACKLKVVSTSGSTGKPLFTYLSGREDAFRKAKLLRPHVVCGQKPGDKWIVIGPPRHSGNVSGLQRFLNFYVPIWVSVFDDAVAQASAIGKLKPDVLDGYSNSLFLIANEVEKNGIETIRPRFVMGGAELIDMPSRRFLEEVFNAPFYDQYASEELQMIAWQCPEKLGYHIDADSIVMQFVDEEGEEVAPGEKGEIVCTSLFNYAMPIIRYALGDVGIASEETECPCGRTFPLMKVVEGRKDSVVILPDGRKVPALVFGWIMEFYKFYRNIYHYRIIQSKTDFLTILIKKKSEDVNERDMKAELLTHMRSMLAINESEVTIEIEFVDDIPRDRTGKLRKVVSEIQEFEAKI